MTLGTSRLAVDGVLLIFEQGDYPFNEKGQQLYPRYEFFKQVVDVFESSGRVAPVASIEKALVGGPPAMAVSPDGRWLLYTQVDRRDADLALVENFR